MGRRDTVWQNRTGGYIETTNPLGYDVLINGSNKYLNFNTTSGSSGYGFRDNGGTMEYKDSGGSWVSFAGSTAGVSSLNGLTGGLNIVAGSGITVTPSGTNITIAATGGGTGTVTSVSVASANGFAGTVANSTTTPAITISTTVTGLLKGNGTAISAASAGTDYLSPTLASANILVGNGSNVATAVAMSGDATLSNTGVLSIVNDAITFAKFQNITDNSLLGRSAGSTGDMMEITVGTGLSLSGGVLTATGSGTGDVVGPASSTDNAIVRFNGTGGKDIQDSVAILSDTGELSGLTRLDVDNIRVDGNTISSTNTNGNITLAPNGTGVVVTPNLHASSSAGLLIEANGGTDIGLLGAGGGANVTWYGGHNFDTVTASRVAQFSASKTLESSSVTTTELGYLSGVTSAIQTQLNGKLGTTLTSAQIFVGNGSNVATGVAMSGDATLANTGALTIASQAVTYAKIQNVTANTFLANVTGSSATVQEIATNRIPLFSSAITGTPSASTFLRGDGVWATPAGAGTVTSVAMTVPTGLVVSGSPITSSGTLAVTLDTGYVIPTQATLDGKANTSGALTQFVGNNNWKVWYSDGSGDVQELSLGASGTYFKSNGPSSAPSFDTPGGGSVTAGTNIENNSGTVSALTKIISPSQLTADQNNWSPTGWGTDVSTIRIDGDSGFRFITGLSAGATNQIVELRNIGSNPVGLMTGSTASTAANRFEFGEEDVIILPNQSVTIIYDGTSTRWRLWGSYNVWANEGEFTTRLFDDLWTNSSTSTTAANPQGRLVGNGTATIVASGGANYRNRHGVMTLAHSTTVGNRMSYYGFENVNMTNRSGSRDSYMMFEMSIRTGTSLSDATNRYIIYGGFLDSVTGAPADGVYAIYSDDINSGQWVLRATDTLSNLDVNTTVAVAANTWYRIKIMVYPDTSARIFINGTLAGTSSTAFTPTAGRDYGLGVNIRKTAGTLDRVVDVDYLGYGAVYNSAR